MTTPNCQVGAPSVRSWKAIRNVRNPTMQRNRPIAVAASRMPPPRSSWRSVWEVSSAATWVAGIFRPSTAAVANTPEATSSTPSPPASALTAMPGTAAAKPMTPDRNDRRELASTSSSSERTTVGTMADLATW
jgi:hypothetical protein